MQKDQVYLLNPSRLGEEYGALQYVIVTLKILGAQSKHRGALISAAAKALSAIASEPLPREIATGVAAHLVTRARDVRYDELSRMLSETATKIVAQVREEPKGSPFT